MKAQHPRITAMVLCEVVHQDPHTKQFTVRNIFSVLEAPLSMRKLPACCLFVALDRCGLAGHIQIRVEAEVGSGHRVVVQTFPQTPIVGEFSVSLAGMPIDASLRHYISIVHDTEVIGWVPLFRPLTSRDGGPVS